MIKSYVLCIAMFLGISALPIFASGSGLIFDQFDDANGTWCVVKYTDAKNFIVNNADIPVDDTKQLCAKLVRRCLALDRNLFSQFENDACIAMYKGNKRYAPDLLSSVKRSLKLADIRIEHIVALDICKTRINQILIEDLEEFYNLQWLNLDDNKISHIDKDALCGVPLIFLSINDNKLTDLEFTGSLVSKLEFVIKFANNFGITQDDRVKLNFFALGLDSPELLRRVWSEASRYNIHSDDDLRMCASSLAKDKDILLRLLNRHTTIQVDSEWILGEKAVNSVAKYKSCMKDKYKIMLACEVDDSMLKVWNLFFTNSRGVIQNRSGYAVMECLKNFFIPNKKPLISEIDIPQICAILSCAQKYGIMSSLQ